MGERDDFHTKKRRRNSCLKKKKEKKPSGKSSLEETISTQKWEIKKKTKVGNRLFKRRFLQHKSKKFSLNI